jgi:hypothetical protein
VLTLNTANAVEIEEFIIRDNCKRWQFSNVQVSVDDWGGIKTTSDCAVYFGVFATLIAAGTDLVTSAMRIKWIIFWTIYAGLWQASIRRNNIELSIHLSPKHSKQTASS